MVEHRGPSHRFLNVDLTSRSWSVYPISRSDQSLFLGGKGLGLKIYYDIVGSGDLGAAEPLGPDNPLIFSLGPMLGTGASCTARFEVLARSPLTGLMVGSSCGGPFGESCRTAGWDGVIIRGRAESPTLLRIHKHGAEFQDAAALWGLGTGEAQDRLNLGPKEAAALIGPAGENMVPYAVIRSGHRFAGRGGVGAVMGSKNLKAVIARGKDYRITPADADLFQRTVNQAKKHILRNGMLKDYRVYGTLSNVRHGIENDFVPVHNFRDRRHPDTEQLSGQAMAERYSTRHSSCRHCTVLCGHKGHYPDGIIRQIPEYETVGMFGSNIGNFDPDLIAAWNDVMNELGLDTISAGGTIAWAMEAGERGLRQTELRFGRTDNIAAVLEDIAYRRAEGADLAEGSRALSRRYGGRDFAIHVKGLECAAYDPRSAWGHGLGYAVYNKGGCHLGSFLVGLERIMGYMLPHITMGKARWVAFMENLYAGVNSLQVCQFTIYGLLTEPPIPRLLPRFVLKFATAVFPRLAISLMDWRVLSRYYHSATGIPMNKWEFLRAGERIIKLERRMAVEMGLDPKEDTLPGRFTQGADAVPIQTLVQSYYKVRGYGADGGPTEADLGHLMKDRTRRRSVRPSSRSLKRLYCTVILGVLGWFIPAVACRKSSVRDEVSHFPEGFNFRFGVSPDGPSVAFSRAGQCLKRIRPGKKAMDMDVTLKSLEAAWLLFSFQESTCNSEARGRLAVKGELNHSCTFIRLMDKVEILLLPRFIARRAVKKWERVA